MNILNNGKVNSISTSNPKETLNLVKIKNIGKSSLRLVGDKLIIKSLDSQYDYQKSLEHLDFLLFSEGNFLLDDKFIIGIDGEQFEISCIGNENDFKTFYTAIKTQKNKSGIGNKNKPTEIKSENKQDIKNKENTPVEEKEEKVTINVSEEIRNFHHLMKEGIISEEEFEDKKKELLKMKIE